MLSTDETSVHSCNQIFAHAMPVLAQILAPVGGVVAQHEHIAQGSGLLHGLAGLPTGAPASLPSIAAAGHAQPIPNYLLQSMPGTAVPGAQQQVLQPHTLPHSVAAASLAMPVPGRALPVSAPGQMRPLHGLAAAAGMQPFQHHPGAVHSNAELHAATAAPADFVGQMPAHQLSMSSSAPVLGSGQPNLPQLTGAGPAPALPGASTGLLQQPDIRQPVMTSSSVPGGHAAAHVSPAAPVQASTAAVPAYMASSMAPLFLSGKAAQLQSRPMAGSGAQDLHSDPGSQSQSSPHDRHNSQRAQGPCSQIQKPVKGGDGLHDVQANSSAVDQAESHGALNGHHHKSQPSGRVGVPNGAYEQGPMRSSASGQHGYTKSEHGSEKGRPPEVEAGYS